MIDKKEKIIGEVKNLCNELGRFPTCKELKSRALLSRLYRTGLSARTLKVDLGYLKPESRPSFWTEAKIAKYLQDIGQRVTYSQLPTTLKNVIKTSNKSLYDYLDDLGINHPKHKRYWLNFDNLRQEIMSLIKKNNGQFPSLPTIEQSLGSAAKRVVLQRGGIFALAADLGLPYRDKLNGRLLITSDGHIVQSSMEFLFDEYLYSRDIHHTVGQKIINSSPYLYDFKIGDFYIEIWGYEKNRDQNPIVRRYNSRRSKKEKLYKDNGLHLISIESSLFRQPIPKIIDYFDSIIRFAGFDPVPTKTINLEGYYQNCKLWNIEKILYDLKEIIKITGRFPTQLKLKEMGRGDLVDAISKHGGQIYCANLLGYSKKPRETWTDEKILNELKKIICHLNRFPTHSELVDLDMGALSQSMIRYGGTQKWKNLLISTEYK